MKGKVTIGKRYDSRLKAPSVVISVEDVDAGTVFLEVDLALDQFAEAVTGLANVPCELEVRNLDIVGKKVQTKWENVFVATEDYSLEARRAAAAEAFKEYEVDGWTGSIYYATETQGKTYREWDGKKGYWITVPFTRHVEKKRK